MLAFPLLDESGLQHSRCLQCREIELPGFDLPEPLTLYHLTKSTSAVRSHEESLKWVGTFGRVLRLCFVLMSFVSCLTVCVKCVHFLNLDRSCELLSH